MGANNKKLKDIKLPSIKANLKSGRERLIYNEEETEFTLLDFWRWGFSDILSNATRGKFAEFIVATAVGADLKTPSDEWGAYDLLTPDGIKIEVKTSAFIQSWAQKDYSKPVFSIRPAKYWDHDTGMSDGEAKRHADVYVFCLLKEKDQSKINPLILDQWEFYVVPTTTLNNYKRSSYSITLPSLRKLTEPISYDEIFSALLNSL